ncbi:hypothetical protein IJG72_01770 [bacterium]|nr:hypothetical protein [bacterium]
MVLNADLKNECLAIGSLPNTDVESAIDIVKKYYNNIPFWPQLPKISRHEDMTFQYLENMPGIVFDEEIGKVYFDAEKETFSGELEQLFITYEEVLADINSENLDLYGLTEEYSKSFKPFLKFVEDTKPKFAKGQITGPFTLSTSLTDKENKCAYYDETLREAIVKTLTLKALWQIKEIKKVSPDTTPIIFIDEPTLSQLGTSAYVTIPPKEIVEMIKEISDLIKSNGALSAIHCCGKCDWSVPIEVGMNILNFDAFSFAENMSLYSEELKPFLNSGGILAWGIVPTLDKEALSMTSLDEIKQKFTEAKDLLIQKGLEKDLLENRSMISPSCGCGSLSVELAQKAIKLTKELSESLKG